MGGKYYWDEVIVYRLYLTSPARLTQYIVILIDLKVVHKEPDQLTRTWTPELSRVILLLNQTCLGIDHDMQSAHFLMPVHRVTLSIKQHKQTTICKRSSANHSPSSIEIQSPGSP